MTRMCRHVGEARELVKRESKKYVGIWSHCWDCVAEETAMERGEQAV